MQTTQFPHLTPGRTLFEQAAAVFDGYTDPETGTDVLRLYTRGADGPQWSTAYHQHRCFLDGGRKILLHTRGRNPSNDFKSCFLLDISTGEAESPFPDGAHVIEVMESSGLASIVHKDEDGRHASIWDMRSGQTTVTVPADGWIQNGFIFLCDDEQAILFQHRGQHYAEHVQSRHILFGPNQEPKIIMEADGYFCSHVVGHPSDVQLYAYDRWPSPYREVEQAIHLRSLDGSFHEPLRMDANTLRPGNTWGARDHYVWTPNGNHIVSYLAASPIGLSNTEDFNHYLFDWWLSATDWRTGEDLSAEYPPGRWGGHMQMSNDSRYILCAGGPGFDKLFAVDLQGLRDGWNEHIICSYPETISTGKNHAPFPYPWMLPDGSGVVFSAGWPGPEHGIYLAKWPEALR